MSKPLPYDDEPAGDSPIFIGAGADRPYSTKAGDKPPRYMVVDFV